MIRAHVPVEGAVPLRQPSARQIERDRIATVMAAPAAGRARARTARRETERKQRRGTSFRRWCREYHEETRTDYAANPGEEQPARRRAALRALGAWLRGAA